MLTSITVATLRERWASFAGAFVALCLGAAVLAMTGLVLASARAQPPARYAGAPVLVQSPPVGQGDGFFTENLPWSPETARSLTRELGRIPGVRAAVPDRSFYVQVVLDGRPVAPDGAGARGHGWSSAALAPYRLVAGAPPVREGQVVLHRAAGPRPGQTVTLLTASGPAPYTVTGLVDGPGVYVADAEAARLSGGVRVIGLLTRPGTDPHAVEAAAARVAGSGGGRVLAGDSRGALEAKADARVRWIGMQVLSAMAGLSGFVAVFVVASTFAFAVAQRRREFGLLRAVGATPRQVRRMVSGEALAVGVVAAAAGIALGTALAPVLAGLLVEAGLEPRGFHVVVQAWPLAAAFGAGLSVAMLGVLAASRRAGAVPPLEALREAEVDARPMTRARWVAGGACTFAGLALTVVTALGSPDDMVGTVLYAAMALIAGVTLLAPAIIPLLVRALWWPLRRRGRDGAIGMLVRETTLTATRRTASTAAPVLVTVGFAILISGMTQLRVTGYLLDDVVSAHAAAVTVPDGTPGLSDAAVAATPGASLLPTTLYVKGAGGAAHLSAQGMDPASFAQVRGRLDVVSGSPGSGSPGLRGLAADAMVVRASTASRFGWRAGTVAPLTFDDGRTVPLRVVAVVSDRSAAAEVTLARPTVRAHDPSALTQTVFLATPGGRAGVGAQVLDRATYAAVTESADDRLVRLFVLILIGMSLGYSVVSIGNTLVMAMAGRLRDLRVLRLSGATTRQVMAMAAGESALAVGIGSVLGAAIAVMGLVGMRTGLSARLGTAVTMHVPWQAAGTVTVTCLLVAVTASVVTCRAAGGG